MFIYNFFDKFSKKVIVVNRVMDSGAKRSEISNPRSAKSLINLFIWGIETKVEQRQQQEQDLK